MANATIPSRLGLEYDVFRNGVSVGMVFLSFLMSDQL